MASDVERAVLDYLSHLSVERGLAANTLTSYRRDLRRYLDHLATRHIASPAEISEADVLAFLGALRTGDSEHPPLGAASAARAVVAVRGFHKFCVRERVVAADVSAAVKPPRPASRLPKALPLAQIEAILEAAGAAGTSLAKRDRALLEFLYGTGARISEAVGLDVDDIDLVERSVLLRGKGSKQRVVPFGVPARKAVDAWLDARPASASTALFLNTRGARVNSRSVYDVVASILIELPGTGPAGPSGGRLWSCCLKPSRARRGGLSAGCAPARL